MILVNVMTLIVVGGNKIALKARLQPKHGAAEIKI